jgi:uncharacterized Zn finger protein (UPF0148 family)
MANSSLGRNMDDPKICKECGTKLIIALDGVLVCPHCGIEYGLSPWISRIDQDDGPTDLDDFWSGWIDNGEKTFEEKKTFKENRRKFLKP